jgi:hypothetical protein
MPRRSQRRVVPPDVERALGRVVDLVQSATDELLAIAGRDSADDHSSSTERIAGWLYQNWYTAQPDPEGRTHSTGPFNDLRGVLRIATAASRRWQQGWVARQVAPNGLCLAGNKAATRQLQPGQYANVARPGLPLAPGDALVVNELVDWVDEPSGFWFSQSPHGGPSNPLIRVYFNVGWQHLGHVLGEATARFDEAGTRYMLKCPVRADGLSRTDTLVVYAARERWQTFRPLLVDLASSLHGQLREATPPLTRIIAPGVAVAEDPGDGTSFGEARCRALAAGVVALLRRPRLAPRKAVTLLAEALHAASVDPHEPWRAIPG